MNSHNFKLQTVGNIETVTQYLNFEIIDELVILNADRQNKDVKHLAEIVREISKKCFVPITAGGGVSKTEDFNMLLRSGADKVAINTSAFENRELVIESSEIFGSQCVVASIDAKKEKGHYTVYVKNGSLNINKNPVEWAKELEKLGAGEIFLTSIDRDGTGQGYDTELINSVASAVKIPLIASGGVGEFQHLVDGIIEGGISAVSAANIFHFIGEGMFKAKVYMGRSGLEFPHTLWNF